MTQIQGCVRLIVSQWLVLALGQSPPGVYSDSGLLKYTQYKHGAVKHEVLSHNGLAHLHCNHKYVEEVFRYEDIKHIHHTSN